MLRHPRQTELLLFLLTMSVIDFLQRESEIGLDSSLLTPGIITKV